MLAVRTGSRASPPEVALCDGRDKTDLDGQAEHRLKSSANRPFGVGGQATLATTLFFTSDGYDERERDIFAFQPETPAQGSLKERNNTVAPKNRKCMI